MIEIRDEKANLIGTVPGELPECRVYGLYIPATQNGASGRLELECCNFIDGGKVVAGLLCPKALVERLSKIDGFTPAKNDRTP